MSDNVTHKHRVLLWPLIKHRHTVCASISLQALPKSSLPEVNVNPKLVKSHEYNKYCQEIRLTTKLVNCSQVAILTEKT